MRRACLLLLLLVPACAQEAPGVDRATTAGSTAASPAPAGSAAPGVDPVDALRAVPAAVRAAGSVRYTAVTEGGRTGEPHTVEARMSGVLDTAADAGTAELQLVALEDLASGAASAGEQGSADDLGALARTALSWTADQLTVRLAGPAGEAVSGPRDDADSGILSRVPNEPAGLFDVVAAATGLEVAGTEQLDGTATTHLTGEAQPRAAVEAGLGTQAQLAIAALPSLPVEVWLDGAGRPARIRYSVALPSLQGGTRDLVTTYDYRGWGEPVDVTP